MEQVYQELGQRVARARDEAGITQERLAVAVGLSRTSIVNLEAGRQRLPIHQLYKIAGALGRQASELLPTAPDLDEKVRREEWVTKITNLDGDST